MSINHLDLCQTKCFYILFVFTNENTFIISSRYKMILIMVYILIYIVLLAEACLYIHKDFIFFKIIPIFFKFIYFKFNIKIIR